MKALENKENEFDMLIEELNRLSHTYGLDFGTIRVKQSMSKKKKCKFVKKWYTHKGVKKVKLYYVCND